ncbi:DNA cytosine methyltransferase [Rhizobium leguminosarum]|uniref:DNA cytosine methyltransferase n=1 Tax=Rhizobium leguminosarum TaxID=384 RepID=UPI003F98C63E
MWKFGDLYAGAGLFSFGMKSAGFTPAFAVELSSDAAQSYRQNISDCVINASAAEVHDVESVDVLIAGPPCQGFSTLGRRDPLDVRNDLCLAILPWVDRVEPKVVVVENVPPFVRSSHWELLAAGLRSRGFSLDVWELDATDYGSPQIRKRAFTVASAVGPIAPPERASSKATAGDALFGTPLDPQDPMHYWPTPSDLAMRRISLIPSNGDKRDLMRLAPELCPPSWNQIGCQATDVWGRIDSSVPANTIRCTFQNPSKGRYLHPEEHRVISLREGARLQGVPDSWIFAGRPYPIARQIGNGVPIPLGAAVGRAIYGALDSATGSERISSDCSPPILAAA